MTPQQLVCDGKVMSMGSMPLLQAGLKEGKSHWLLRYDLFSFTMNMKPQISDLITIEWDQSVDHICTRNTEEDRFYALRNHITAACYSILLYCVDSVLV